MSLKKNKCYTRHRAYDTEFKSGCSRMLPSGFESICVNDRASASTSNESILLSEMEKRHNEALGDRYPDFKNNNKCKSTSIILDTHDESYVHKSILLRPESNLKHFIKVNRSDNMEQKIIIGGENVMRSERNLNNRNEVPESCKLVTLQNTVCKTELIPECLNRRANLDCAPKTFPPKKLLSFVKCNKPGTPSVEANNIFATSGECSTSISHNLCTIKDNAHLINSDTVPDRNKRDFQQGKINDCIVSNNFSERLTDDNILPMEMQSKIVNEQNSTLSDERTTAKDQETKEIENGVITLPAIPTRSLPSDLKASIEDNDEKKSGLIKVKNKLLSSTQSFTEKMQLTIADDHPKSTGECNKQELKIRQQIVPQISHKDTNMQKSVSEVTNENIVLQNNAVHQDACTASEINVKQDEQNQLPVVPNVKRKRGRPRKMLNDSTNQSTPNKPRNDDTSQEISDTITESTTRNKRRASKIRIITSISDLSDESDTLVNDKIFVRKRGRPPGSRGRGRIRGRGRGTLQNSLDVEYIPRLTAKDGSQLRTKGSDKIDLDGTNTTADHVTNIENAATDSNTPNIQKAVQLVTCAKCNKEIPKKQWSSHKLHQHNNMTWQKDEEPLDFENDKKLLKRVLASALKQKKKYLTCEKCETAKRSVDGFISHMQFCGKSEEERQALMVTCPICEAVMMPSSVEVHERYHRQLEKNKNQEPNIQVEKTKRKAAERAVPKILELTESLKEQNLCTNNVIQTPEKKKIPSAWKVMWKKELASKNIASCKQLGCTFTCSSYKTICEHYYECNFTPQENFMCKICKFSADSKDEIVEHITKVHSSNNDLEKYSDYEIEEDEDSSDESIFEYEIKRKFGNRRSSKISSDTKTCNKMAFLDKETLQNSQSNKAYKPALLWTLDFELKNYELALFKDDIPNCFTLLGNNDAATYFPELTVSMAIKHVNVNLSKNVKNSENDWKRMNRFEGDIYEAVPTFFVGGPIWALAWLPIPSPMYCKNPTQYIAISTHPTMESKYAVGNKYSGSNIIQIYDVGPLNYEVNSKNRSPVLAYAIAHNSGTVWCLEWCPSGCYQDVALGNYEVDKSDKLRRMGLLAAACSDGCINIYSLPFTDELRFQRTEYNSWPIYKTDPVMTLVVNLSLYDDNEQNCQCTKLSWTKEHGHSIIAAGFTNGYIALWDLTTTSPLLFSMRKDTKFINAFQHFFAHTNAITMVALVPYSKSRFLASASVDRSYKFWNLEDTSAPQNCMKKGIIVNGVWMMHWPCAVLSFDDALGYHYTHSFILPIREYGYKNCPILATNSPTYSIAVSDYANSISHGTLAGEVLSIFPHQLLYTEKILPKKRQLNSFIETVDFLEEQQHSKDNENKNDKKSSKEYHYMPATYDGCKDRFGIIFHDNLMDLKKSITKGKQKDTLNNNKLMSVPIEQYPFTSVNRMAWNPNAWSYLWLATGYENGLVRLLNLNRMSTSHGLNTLLSAHVKSMLAKRE